MYVVFIYLVTDRHMLLDISATAKLCNWNHRTYEKYVVRVKTLRNFVSDQLKKDKKNWKKKW